MENDNKMGINHPPRVPQFKNQGQRVRSITPCLLRNDEIPMNLYQKKASLHLQQSPLSIQNQNYIGRSPSYWNNFTNQSTQNQQISQEIMMQAQGIPQSNTSKQGFPLPESFQKENVFQIYQDIFNNENNRFRSVTPNLRRMKRIGNIKQKNENSYIINQVQQNQKQLANQNKDMLMLTNYWEKKQLENGHVNQGDHHHPSNVYLLPTLPISPSQNAQHGDNNSYSSRHNISHYNAQNPFPNLEDSPEKMPLPKYNQKSQQQQQHQNISFQEDSPLKKAGDTTHFNSFLQKQIMEYVQNQKITYEEKKGGSTAARTTQRNSIFDNSFLVEKQAFVNTNNNTKGFLNKQRSATPSQINSNNKQVFFNSNINSNITKRRQLKLNKSNLNFFPDKNIHSPTYQGKKLRTQGDVDENEDDSNLFFKYGDEGLFQMNQNDTKKNSNKQNIRTIKDTLVQIVQPEEIDDPYYSQQTAQQSNSQITISNIKSYQKNPSVVQYTPKSTMQKYSKVQRFIPIQNRIIRYPAFINIMHNTTRDQSFSILKKNKLIDIEDIKNYV